MMTLKGCWLLAAHSVVSYKGGWCMKNNPCCQILQFFYKYVISWDYFPIRSVGDFFSGI